MVKKKINKKSVERKEALMRLVVSIVTGIIVYLWGYVAYFLIAVNWIVALVSGSRNQTIAEFVENWNSTVYYFARYISGVSNERPFPFAKLKTISKFQE